MKIVLSGVETNNKGAELMLYAILQEIERKYPDAEVYIPSSSIIQGKQYIKTHLKLKTIPFGALISKLHIRGILRKFHLPQKFLVYTNTIRDADWFFDGSGFTFGDQWFFSEGRIQMWKDMLGTMKENKCKIVFLPQAFGPVNKDCTKKILTVINKYADVLMPREQVSYNYLKQSGVIDMEHVRKYTDFTSLVDGEFPKDYFHLRDGICIIPNMQMIKKGIMQYDEYIYLLSSLMLEGKKSGHPVYLLNHEGKEDAELCIRCKLAAGNNIEAVTNLNALQVKGLISSAYLVITSRYHGLASALNSGVPCLSTSWSHKYQELYYDYGLDSYVLPINNVNDSIELEKKLMDPFMNMNLRQKLSIQVPKIKDETRSMWDFVWMMKK